MLTKEMLIILACLVAGSQGQQIQLPPVQHPKTQQIKLGTLYLDQTCNIEGIVMRNVTQASQPRPFPPCTSNPPELVIEQLRYVAYPEWSNRASKILTKFQQVKLSQFQLDSYFDATQHLMYIMLRTGDILIYNQTSDGYLQMVVVGLEEGQLLEVGYFVKMGGTGPLLFVNAKYCIKVTLGSAVFVNNYMPAKEYDNFETALPINSGRNLAVASHKGGICIYQYDEDLNKLSLALHLGTNQVLGQGSKERLSVSDLAWEQQRGYLYILDEGRGVYRMQISQSLEWKQVRLVHEEALCDLLYLEAGIGVYFVGCSNHIVMQRVDQPEQKQLLPHPEIKIREIEGSGRMVVFTGRNVFKVYDLQARQYLQYYQQFMKINKMHLTMDTELTGHFYFTNEYVLMAGTFYIDSPYVTCSTRDPTYLGKESQIQLLNIGPCDTNYINKYYRGWYAMQGGNLASFDAIKYKETDTCIYDIYQTLYFWVPGHVDTQPLLIGLVVILAITAVVLLLNLLYKFRVNRLTSVLNQYLSMDDSNHPVANNEQGRHQQLVEEEDNSGRAQEGDNSRRVQESKNGRTQQDSQQHFRPSPVKEQEVGDQQQYDIE